MHEIDVVIPTLGRASLERAVASVASQSHPPHELIIVANGSQRLEAAQVEHLRALAKPIPLRVLPLPPFSGPSITRNLGAWEAETEHVAFLDDDDEFAPNYLESMWTQIMQANPDVLYGAKVWRNDDGSVRREKRLSMVPRSLWFDRLYRQENPGFGGTNLVARREAFFELGGFPVDLPSGEDRAFAMAALKARCHVVYVDEAEVSCHDPDGYRATRRSDKPITNLKLIRQYWADVGWASRLRSVLRWTRSFVRGAGRSSNAALPR